MNPCSSSVKYYMLVVMISAVNYQGANNVSDKEDEGGDELYKKLDINLDE